MLSKSHSDCGTELANEHQVVPHALADECGAPFMSAVNSSSFCTYSMPCSKKSFPCFLQVSMTVLLMASASTPFQLLLPPVTFLMITMFLSPLSALLLW